MEILDERKLSVKEAATYLGVSKSWLDKLRVFGGVPTFCRLGKRVVYERIDLDDWVAPRKRLSTSAY